MVEIIQSYGINEFKFINEEDSIWYRTHFVASGTKIFIPIIVNDDTSPHFYLRFSSIFIERISASSGGSLSTTCKFNIYY